MTVSMNERQRQCVPKTKFAVPPLPSHLVSRTALLAKLDSRQDALVTLVSAAAGSGKTVLLAEWARGRSAVDTAWVCLDADDNDDRRFWTALIEGLSGCDAIPGDSPFRRLVVPPRPSSDPRFLADVVNALDALPRKVWLVLDDLHELTHAPSLRGFEAVLRYQPAGLRLVLSTRHDPSLPFGRLRLTDQLAEIRAEDLRFSSAEARVLLDAVGVDLDDDQLGRLLAQTEGWAAGLRLATLSVSGLDDPDRFLDDFAANDRAVGEYLAAEVLSRLPDRTCDFLTSISVCERVSVDLAAELSGQTDAGALFDSLTRRTSLVIRSDARQQWYQVHRLLRSHLLTTLGRHDPDLAARLHSTAARWFARQDQATRSLAHASQAGDATLAGVLARRYAISLLLNGDLGLLRSVLDVLGTRLIAEDSRLSLVSALLHLETGETVIADRDLAAAEENLPPDATSELIVLYRLAKARRAQVSGNVDDMLLATEDLEPGFEDDCGLDALARLYRGVALSADGRVEAAREHVEAALHVARTGGHDYLEAQCVAAFGVLAVTEGRLGRAAELAGEVYGRHAGRGTQHSLEASIASGVLGYTALLRADLHECVRQAARAGQLGDAGNGPLNLLVETLRGAAEFELGDWTGGARRVLRARLAAGETRFPPHQVAMTTMIGHRAALLLGWSEAAAHHLRWAEAVVPDSGEVRLLRARALLTLGRYDAVGKMVRPVSDGSVPVVMPWTVIEAWLLDCEAALGAGADERAQRALKNALRAAQRIKVCYPVVFARADVIALMSQQLGAPGPLGAFVRQVLSIRESLRLPAMPAPLTPSERAILFLLPTFRSLDEIAEDLMVSPNTVKTHVRSIYAKLGVSRRSDAVEVASQQGLLDVEQNAWRDR